MLFSPNIEKPITIDNLPFPLLQAAVREADFNLQTPPGMALITALLAASLTAQGNVDVRMPTGQQVAASLMAMIIANSGERKTATEATFFRAIREREAILQAAYEKEFHDYRARLKIWSTVGDVKKKLLKKSIERGLDTAQISKEIEQHLRNEPEEPVRFKIIFDDSTVPALLHGLRQVPLAGLVSSEGGGALGGPIFDELAKLNALWSGGPVYVDRVSSGSFVISDGRVCVLLMVQPAMFQAFLSSKGDKTRGSGLAARALICVPGTTQGMRQLYNTQFSWDACDRFNSRSGELLDKAIAGMRDPAFKRTVLKLSAEAERDWLDYFNYVETNIQPGGRYAQAGDHASKLAENVARVAAVLHCFEGFEGDISRDTLRGAICIVDLASVNFMQVFCKPPEFDEAEGLYGWMVGKYRNNGQRFVAKSLVHRYSPNMYRNRALLTHLLAILEQSGMVRLIRRNKSTIIDLLPWLPDGSMLPTTAGLTGLAAKTISSV